MTQERMKKIIVRILIGILGLLLVVALIFKLYGNRLVRTGIIFGTQKALQVDVRLESIDLRVAGGKVDLKNMEIDNPEGYNHPTFMKMGRAYMDLDVLSLMSETVEIEKVQLDEMHLLIEQKGKTNNLKEILNHLPQSESTEAEPEPAEEGTGKNVQIKVLEINTVEVKAKLLPIAGQADTVTLMIKPIRLENLGTDEKIDMAGVTAKVLKAISKGIAEQGADVLPTDMIGSISGELGKQGKALLKGTQDIGNSTTDSVKDFGGLFKMKDEKE